MTPPSGQGIVLPVTLSGHFGGGEERASQVPGGPPVHMPCSLTPAGLQCSLPQSIGVLPSVKLTTSAPATSTLSKLNCRAYGLPVYASQDRLPYHHATLGSSCRHAWLGGLLTHRVPMESFRVLGNMLLPLFPIPQAWPGALK